MYSMNTPSEMSSKRFLSVNSHQSICHGLSDSTTENIHISRP
jgi:hypothetical protein